MFSQQTNAVDEGKRTMMTQKVGDGCSGGKMEEVVKNWGGAKKRLNDAQEVDRHNFSIYLDIRLNGQWNAN